jgi:hypothetical protein
MAHVEIIFVRPASKKKHPVRGEGQVRIDSIGKLE